MILLIDVGCMFNFKFILVSRVMFVCSFVVFSRTSENTRIGILFGWLVKMYCFGMLFVFFLVSFMIVCVMCLVLFFWNGSTKTRIVSMAGSFFFLVFVFMLLLFVIVCLFVVVVLWNICEINFGILINYVLWLFCVVLSAVGYKYVLSASTTVFGMFVFLILRILYVWCC